MNEWVEKVKPGYKPDLFAMYSWASGRLFFQALEKAGPQADRRAVVAELAKVTEFSANQLVAPAGPGNKRTPVCQAFMQVQDGKWVRLEPKSEPYRCEGAGLYKT